MGSNGCTPEEALELLMKKVQARDETLAIQIQAAIDSGKDVLETDPAVVGEGNHANTVERFRLRLGRRQSRSMPSRHTLWSSRCSLIKP